MGNTPLNKSQKAANLSTWTGMPRRHSTGEPRERQGWGGGVGGGWEWGAEQRVSEGEREGVEAEISGGGGR